MKFHPKFSPLLLIIFLLGIMTDAAAQNLPAYKIYDQKGKSSNFKKMAKALQEADIILFGELHNNPIHHWLQLELTKEIYKAKGAAVILGAEMLEADNQQALDQYLSGNYNFAQFRENARLWPNFTTDYKPLVDFAKSANIPFVATNIPRRYASMVARGGVEALDTLPAEARQWMAPMPYEVDLELPGYKAFFEMDFGHSGMNAENMARAQAIKDATMAHFIMQHFQTGKLFIHYNGAYHSNNFEGIYWYLKRLNPNLKIMTIGVAEAENAKLMLPAEAKQIANFIIVTPSTMTKTH